MSLAHDHRFRTDDDYIDNWDDITFDDVDGDIDLVEDGDMDGDDWPEDGDDWPEDGDDWPEDGDMLAYATTYDNPEVVGWQEQDHGSPSELSHVLAYVRHIRDYNHAE